MKKLLVLALLGLGLGGGVWKLQNPDGTVEDLRTQAQAVASRLQGGVQAGVQSVRQTNPATVMADAQEQQALADRLTRLESTNSEQQSLAQRLSDLEKSVNEPDLTANTIDNAAANDEQLIAFGGLLSGVEARLESTNQRSSAQTDTIEALSVTIAELDQKIGASTPPLDELGASVKELSAGNEAGIIRMDAIDSRLELLVRRLDEQTTSIDLQALNDSVATINTQLIRIDDSNASLEESISSDLAAASERADALNLRLNTLASPNQAASTNADANAETDADAGTSVSAFNADLDKRFSAIETRLATVNSDSRRIAVLTEQLEAAQEKITQLEVRDVSTTQTVEEINGSIAELKTASDSLSIDTVQAEVRDQLALVQSQLESNIAANNTDALEQLLDSTRSQIETLEKQVQELPASSSEADNAQQIQSALESQIAALEKRLETASNTDPALVSSLTNVQEQVDQLNAQGFVTQDDLRAQAEGKSVEYKIYFDRNSADVTDDAAKVLSSFIAQEKNRTTGVSIFGFTDRRGSAIYNQQLALQRATNVRSFLIQNGLDYTKIKALSGLGEDAAAAILPDNSDDAQQRVVVLYAAQK